ncbi:MAG: adenylyl-sulfate kinase [Bacteroidetes bacterium]|nr:adenylyl-sulfate kinase [Bacteroidota bacterium]
MHIETTRERKEKRLRQRAKAIWFTGLSGSGKTTLGTRLEQSLSNQGFLIQLLDGDVIRAGINNNLGFSVVDRTENIRRVAEVNRLFIDCGIITINCFISPTVEIRELAKRIIGETDFLEIYLDSSLEVCEQRDVKGLYSKARKGLIPEFTGITSPYEIPLNPFLRLDTATDTKDYNSEILINTLISKIKY